MVGLWHVDFEARDNKDRVFPSVELLRNFPSQNAKRSLVETSAAGGGGDGGSKKRKSMSDDADVQACHRGLTTCESRSNEDNGFQPTHWPQYAEDTWPDTSATEIEVQFRAKARGSHPSLFFFNSVPNCQASQSQHISAELQQK